MKIQTQVFLVIGALTVLFLSIVLLVVRPQLLNEANAFDQHDLQEDIGRVDNYFEQQKDKLVRLNRDWAYWDDTYRFINEGEVSYIDSNLADETFTNNEIHYMLFLNSDYEAVHQKGYHYDREEPLGIDPSFVDNVIREVASTGGGNRSFFLRNGDQMMMLSTHDVALSDTSGAGESGALVMGKLINDTYIKEIGTALSVNLALSGEALPSEIEKKGDTLVGSLSLQGVAGAPPIFLSISGPRIFYNEIVEGSTLHAIILVLGSCLLSLILFLVFKHFAITPVSNLSRQMTNVRFEENFSSRVAVPRKANKEIAELEASINSMLDKLEQTHGEALNMAYNDQLTQLSNRFFLYQEFPRFLENYGENTALLFFDLDGFKRVNDTWGHEIGDLLLKRVASRLKEYFQQDEVILSRIGGDEFVVVLAYADEGQLHTTTTELLAFLNREYKLGSVHTYITASVGVSMYPTDGTALVDLLKHADIAMYEAKTNGKNKVVYFRDLTDESHYHQLSILKNDVMFALQREELRLVYQPIYYTGRNKIAAFEALLRWNHPKMGPVPPDTFISLMEENDTIHEVGEWVIVEGLKQLKQWRKKTGETLALSVNFSKVQLVYADHFLDVIDRTLKDFDLPPESLYIEITESDVAVENEDVVCFIHELQDRGVQVAIDDFGVGTSSLYGLRELSVDVVKIDRSFIQRIEDAFDKSLLAGIYRILKELNIDIITEGVETREQLDFVVKNNIPKTQGYYFSKPVEASEVEPMLKLHRKSINE